MYLSGNERTFQSAHVFGKCQKSWVIFSFVIVVVGGGKSVQISPDLKIDISE